METTQSLLEIINVKPALSKLSESCLVVVDAQREYTEGKVPLYDIDRALSEISAILALAREKKSPVFHLVHHLFPGAEIFNPESRMVEIVEQAAPIDDEVVIKKNYPSGFAGTDLGNEISRSGRTNLIIVGFMTHMCIDATARSAHELGYQTTVVASACATRDLKDQEGNLVKAVDLHRASLAALSDLVAGIARNSEEVV